MEERQMLNMFGAEVAFALVYSRNQQNMLFVPELLHKTKYIACLY